MFPRGHPIIPGPRKKRSKDVTLRKSSKAQKTQPKKPKKRVQFINRNSKQKGAEESKYATTRGRSLIDAKSNLHFKNSEQISTQDFIHENETGHFNEGENIHANKPYVLIQDTEGPVSINGLNTEAAVISTTVADRYAVEWSAYARYACIWHMLTVKSGSAKAGAMKRDGVYDISNDIDQEEDPIRIHKFLYGEAQHLFASNFSSWIRRDAQNFVYALTNVRLLHVALFQLHSSFVIHLNARPGVTHAVAVVLARIIALRQTGR